MQLPLLNRWHPVLALRYLPILQHISPKHSVVEIGSGSLGIGPYLKRPFIGIDIDFSGPSWNQMTPIKASATKIPLLSDSFDVVVSMDMLEHLPKKKRLKAICEMFRLAKHEVIIGVPLGQLAHLQDRQLNQLYYQKHNHRHPFLKEQITFGLPTKQDIILAIRSASNQYKKKINIQSFPNLNLKLRFWLMQGWISQNILVNIFFRKILLFFIPFIKLFNQPPVYRQIFVVTIK